MAVRNPDNLARMVIGAFVGGVVGFFGGIFVLRWVATLGTESGWEDLVALVLSMMSFAPVGAILGAVAGWRRDGRSAWTAIPMRRRNLAVAGALLFAVGGAVWGAIAMDPMSAAFLAVWGIPVGGFLGWLVGRIGGAAARSTPA